MKRILHLVVVLSTVVLTTTGCDFFRKLAGRPTSTDIEAMRQAIALREEAKVQAAQSDSIPVVPDTVAAKPEVKPAPAKETVSSSSQVNDGKKRYYIIVASFSKVENAERCAERMAGRGYPGELLKFKGGYTAVGVLGTDDMQEAQASLKELKRQDFCPQGVWILDRNRK